MFDFADSLLASQPVRQHHRKAHLLMQVSFLTQAHAQASLIDLTKRCDSMEWAVAWATPNGLIDEAFRRREKFNHFVIGTHLYQTHPEVLERFAPVPTLRVMPPTGDLFHPKVYIFTSGDLVQAVVGSHNLTHAAMNRNVEASMMFVGSKDDPALVELRMFIYQAWSHGELADATFLYQYGNQYRAKAKAREALTTFVKYPLPRTRGTKRSPHEMSWSDFVRQVKKPRTHSLRNRLAVLDRAGQLFAEHTSFSKMGDDERKLVAGTLGPKKSKQGGTDFALFGSMGGSGTFANIVWRTPTELSHALDAIPQTGPVSETDYNLYTQRFANAFAVAKAKRLGRLPTATRLLAMKRPDVFVCLDEANKEDLCNHFGVSPSTMKFDNYWDRIIDPMMQTEWWQAPMPTDPLDEKIWKGRAALLDAIYYKHSD